MSWGQESILEPAIKRLISCRKEKPFKDAEADSLNM